MIQPELNRPVILAYTDTARDLNQRLYIYLNPCDGFENLPDICRDFYIPHMLSENHFICLIQSQAKEVLASLVRSGTKGKEMLRGAVFILAVRGFEARKPKYTSLLATAARLGLRVLTI